MALTGRAPLLAVVAAVLVALLAPTGAGVVVALLAIVVLLAVDVALAGPVGALRLTRSGDTRVRLGESAHVALEVANPGRRRVRGVLRDAWAPSTGAAPSRVRLDVPPGERRRLDVELTPTRRGDRRPDRVTVRSVGPLGLAARQGSHAVGWQVRVLPGFPARRHLPSRLARLRDLDGRSAVLVRGAGTEFDTLRPYVRGDDTRSIDWRASARSTGLVVRTWRPERDRHVLLVLDTGRTSAGRVGDAPRLDTAMDATLLLAALATRAGDRVDLLAYDRTVRGAVERAAPTEVLSSFVEVLAVLEPALVETDHAGLAAQVRARAGRHALVVVLTGLDPAVVAAGQGRALAALARQHTVVVAAVRDPALAALASDRADVGAVHVAAAAARASTERDAAAAGLRRAGVEVVDAPPDHLAPDLADHYLDLKRAGRL